MTSQTRDLPLCHGTKVSPSGLFPVERHKPCGSFVLGIAAAERARATTSYYYYYYYYHRGIVVEIFIRNIYENVPRRRSWQMYFHPSLARFQYMVSGSSYESVSTAQPRIESSTQLNAVFSRLRHPSNKRTDAIREREE